MSIAISPINIAVACLYLLVAVASGVAGITAWKCNQTLPHRIGWLAVAAFFVLLTALRLFDVAEALRNIARADLRATGAYGHRRALQAPLAAIGISLVAAFGFWAVYWGSRSIRDKRDFALATAVAGGVATALLVALRMVSLHFIDAFLYGPLKPNLIADLALSLLVAGASWRYIKAMRS